MQAAALEPRSAPRRAPALVTGVAATLALAAALPCRAQLTPARPDAAPRFSNLQVLPEDASVVEVFRVMKLMTRALGVQCQSCHRTATREFEADTLPMKAVARAMMHLEQARRPDLDWREPPADLCIVCHRGERHPPDRAANAAP